MKILFKNVLGNVVDGLKSYYSTCITEEEKAGPEYQAYLKMNECKDINDLIDSMKAQGFGEEHNEPLAWWILVFAVEGGAEEKDDEYVCPSCGNITSNKSGTGTCSACECKGVWMDPAGGLHYEGESDPARMYE